MKLQTFITILEHDNPKGVLKFFEAVQWYKSQQQEAVYKGNMGVMEMMKFYQVASDKEQKEMDKVVNKNDWEGFKLLIKKVLGIELK